MKAIQLQWHNALARRKDQGRLRNLILPGNCMDFSSNDYLGLSANGDFQDILVAAIRNNPRCLTGATGSRLITGNSLAVTQVEDFIAAEHQVASALLFPSGYKANIALLSCILGRHDTILADELVHRSVHDGCLMSKAGKWKFRHNDTEHLESLLKKTKGHVVIVVESLYSMDGDFAPLNAIAGLAKKYGAGLVVDEAHAIGVFGKGLVHNAQLQQEVLATVVTYGKAMGVQGAAVLGGTLLKEYLVNFASPFIYSTAMPDVQALSIQLAYEYVNKNDELANLLQERIRYFRTCIRSGISQAQSPIQVIVFTAADQLKSAAEALCRHNIHAYPVFAPTVPAGAERLRICLHQFNSNQEIDTLHTILKEYEQP